MKKLFEFLETTLMNEELKNPMTTALKRRYEQSREKVEKAEVKVKEAKMDKHSPHVNDEYVAKKIDKARMEVEEAEAKKVEELNKLRDYRRLTEATEIKMPKDIEGLLYNGTSGNILKYMLTGEVNMINFEKLDVLKRVENDYLIKVTIGKIRKELRKKNPDRMVIKALKFEFRNIYTKIKNSLK